MHAGKEFLHPPAEYLTQVRLPLASPHSRPRNQGIEVRHTACDLTKETVPCYRTENGIMILGFLVLLRGGAIIPIALLERAPV